MSLVNQNVIAGASGSQSYTIDRSVRLRSSASAYFNRTPASAGSQTTWTYSAWVKRGKLGYSSYDLIRTHYSSTYHIGIYFNSSDTLNIVQWTGSANINLSTTQVFRDPSSWYHIVVSVDSTQATSSNRVKIYVNGVQVTSFSTATYPALNSNTYMCSGSGWTNLIGKFYDFASTYYADGYFSEVIRVDGQALTPSDFGETDAITGVWKPKKYAGTYGTNGFYLNFSDNTSTTTLGYDYSGNGNNWTANNISLTSGVTYDSMTDVPTLTSETAGNYAVVNPIPPSSSGGSWFTQNGNLSLVRNGGGWITGVATIGVTSGKWYWEVIPQNSGNLFTIGIAKDGYDWTTYLGSNAFGWSYEGGAGVKYTNGSSSAYGATYTTNDVIGVAFDADAGTLTFYKNGASQGQAFSGLTSGPYYPACGVSNLNTTAVFNFGQRPFAYTPPTGFKALNTFNLPDSTIVDGSQYFDAVLWTGDNTSPRTVGGLNFQPDFAWTKSRGSPVTGTANHWLYDSVRGAGSNSLRTLASNATSAEFDSLGSNGNATAFTSSGITYTAGTTDNKNRNESGIAYVAWNWKAGGTAVSNTDGSITSSVSANTTSGFSIVTYTGNQSAGSTVGHGLGVAPSMIIVKARGQATSWPVYHASRGATKWILLNSTQAETTTSQEWNNTAPTSSVFTIGNSSANSNQSTTYVAYCFAEVPGFSKFGSYTGNGSADGPFVFTNFRPKWLMVKRTDSASSLGWFIFDTSRNTYNYANLELYANSSSAEATDAGGPDLLSNGFKLRGNGTDTNASGGTYIYAAFAENPTKLALAR